MTDPTPNDQAPSLFSPDASRVLTPGLRTAMCLLAGGLVALWLVIELYGAGGFFALVIGVVVARLTYGRRRSLNVAFAAGVAVFLVSLLLWGSLLADRWDDATATPTSGIPTASPP